MRPQYWLPSVSMGGLERKEKEEKAGRLNCQPGNHAGNDEEVEEDFDESGDIRRSLVVKQVITYYGGKSR